MSISWHKTAYTMTRFRIGFFSYDPLLRFSLVIQVSATLHADMPVFCLATVAADYTLLCSQACCFLLLSQQKMYNYMCTICVKHSTHGLIWEIDRDNSVLINWHLLPILDSEESAHSFVCVCVSGCAHMLWDISMKIWESVNISIMWNTKTVL